MSGFGAKFFLFLNRVIGVSPFDMSLAVMAPKVASQTTSVTLKLHQIIPTYVALCLYVMCLASIFWQNRNASEISFAANWLQFIPNALSYVICLYTGLRNRAISAQILTTFYLCDTKLKDSLGVSFKRFNKRTNFLSYVASFVSIGIALLFGSLSFVKTVSFENIFSFLYWLAFCLPKFSLMLINLQFAGCVYYILSRVQLVKKNMSKSFLNEDQLASVPLIISPNPGNLSPFNKVSPYGKSGNVSRDTQERTCEALKEVVDILQNLCDLINRYFGRQLVMNLLSGFVCITVQLHYTIRQIRYSFATPDSEILVTMSLTLVAMHMMEFLVIFACGDRAREKWNEFISEVQRVRLRISNEELRGKLFEIINTMCYKRIEFHGCNLFIIDLSCVTGLISSVATYLIVLVQFQINEEQSGKVDPTAAPHTFGVANER